MKAGDIMGVGSSLGSIFVEVGADLSKFQSGMKKMDMGLSGIGKKISNFGKNLTMKITLPLAGVAGAAIKTASDAEEMQSKFQSVFKGLSDETGKWAEQQADDLNRSQYAFKGYLAQLQDTFVPMGIARNKAADLSKEVMSLGVDLASFNNEAEPEVINNLTSALVGNHEAVRKFGVVITESSLKQELFNMGIKGGTKAASEQEKMMARLNIIMDSTKDAQGDAARTSGSFANQMRGLKADLEETAVEIGQHLIPIAQDLINAVKPLIRGFGELDVKQQKTILTIAGIVAGIGPLLFGLGNMMKGISGVSKALSFMAANPVILGITAITAAIGGIAYMATTTSKTVREESEKLIAQWEKEKDAAIEAINAEYKEKMKTQAAKTAANEDAHNERMQQIEEEYQAAIKAAQEEADAKIENIKKQKEENRALYDDSINKIREEYGVYEEKTKSKTDLAVEHYQDMMDAAEETYNEQIRLIEDTYDKEIAAAEEAHKVVLSNLDDEFVRTKDKIDRESSLVIGDIEDKIALLEGASEEEVAIQKQKRLEKRAIELEELIAAETDKTAKEELIKERESIINQLVESSAKKDIATQKWRLRDEILAEKQNVEDRKLKAEELYNDKKDKATTAYETERDEIETTKLAAITAAEEQYNEVISILEEQKNDAIDKIQEEREEKERNARLQYEATKQSLEDQLEEVDKWLEDKKDRLKTEYDNHFNNQLDQYKATKARLELETLELEKEIKKRKDMEQAAYEERVAQREEEEKEFENSMLGKQLIKAGEQLSDITPDSIEEAAGKTSNFIKDNIVNPVQDFVNNLFGGVPKMATGGIVSSPTLAMIGEGGEREAVIPLSKLDRYTNNNIDYGKLADAVFMGFREAMRGQGSNQGGDIVMQVNGREFARIIYPYTLGEENRLGVEPV